VETQGSIGIENELTMEQITGADVVILTNNIGIKNEDRFKGKPVVRVSAGDCINKGEAIVKKIQQKLAK
ncbi:MAG: PTS fructose transporter subunit IIB, partial [Enterococcus gilvus]